MKVLVVVFLCLLSASIICGVAIAMQNAAAECTSKPFTLKGSIDNPPSFGVEPTGDPIGGSDDWPW